MNKDREDQLDKRGRDYSLDEILAEVSSFQPGKEARPAAPKKPAGPKKPPSHPPPPPSPPSPPPSHPTPPPPPENVIHFPGSEEPAPARESLWARLQKKADDYAARMFSEAEPSPEDRRAEELLPGVDEERPRRREPRPLRPRREKLWPDTPPQELAYRYGQGLGSLRVRRALVFLLALPLAYLCLSGPCALPLPGALEALWLQIWVCAGVQALAILLSLDLFKSGLTGLGADTVTVLAAVATLADACTMNAIGSREDSLPYCLVSVLALGCGLWGRYRKRLGLRVTCRTAAAAKTPYIVTLDEEKWDGRAVYAKWTNTTEGFGSQIQTDDGALRVQRPMSALLILACLLFSALSSVGKGRAELFLWCLSATLCSAASFSGALIFSRPFCQIARRLAGVGAALAGWEGIRRQSRGAGILLADADLFPPGSVTLNGIKIFQDFPIDKVVSVTATLIRDMGSGLDHTFHALLRSQGTIYRKASDMQCLEGGASAIIRGELVLVGSAAFMRLMEVDLPAGLNVKNAVFCAIEGELAGIFVLHYALHATVRPALSALISNKISPILATRDFNLIPSMLHQRFKLPVDKMEFPELDRRRELSDSRQIHLRPLVCILCREGIGPLSEAVVGAKRLCFAVRASAFLSSAGSAIGVLIAFYLTAQMAFSSLSVLNLLIFLLMWLIPTLLISGWVNRY